MKSFGEWELINCLGSGSFGIVYHYRNRKNGLEIATKCLKVLQLKPDEIMRLSERWQQEYRWQKNVDKDCIVKAIDIEDSKFLDYLYQEQQSQCNSLPIIIMEYCNGGDLRTILNRIEHKNGLPEYEVRLVLNCLRNAIEYLHKCCNVVHRDIKPENIILQIKENNHHIYKLADFGYIRTIPDITVTQSVVGTPHYVAPEVIQTGSYNYSVDYWSMGIIAFELICGIRPFIPHCKWVTILENIIKKPNQCIAIVEEFQNDNETEVKFTFKNNIFTQNNCTLNFVKDVERWLLTSLDLNYKTRGRRGNELIFYKEIDKILETTIVTVFSLHTREFFSYVVTSDMSLEEFYQRLRKDTTIKQMHYILPLLHPKGNIKNIKKAIDFYVPEWCDINEETNNPFAMLYVIELEQYDHNAPQAYFSSLSMQQCMHVCPEKSSLPEWLIDDFELKLNYHLTKEQRHLQAYMQGLYYFAVSLEHEIFLFSSCIMMLHEHVLVLKGRLQQFNEIILFVEKESALLNAQTFREIIAMTIQNYGGNFFKQYEEDFSNLRNRYVLLHRDCTREARKDVYQIFNEQDYYKLNSFRLYLQDQENFISRSTERQLKNRLKECQKFVDFWLKQRRKFYENPILKEVSNNLKQFWKLYHTIQCDVWDFQKGLHLLKKNLRKVTESICDGMKKQLRCTQTLTNVSINDKQISPYISLSTSSIIREAAELESSMLASIQDDFFTKNS